MYAKEFVTASCSFPVCGPDCLRHLSYIKLELIFDQLKDGQMILFSQFVFCKSLCIVCNTHTHQKLSMCVYSVCVCVCVQHFRGSVSVFIHCVCERERERALNRNITTAKLLFSHFVIMT